ncbi:YkgJ family cysteine cluster protein [Pseudodesulfovibrio sp.]|uniref:YkgJ family cysteine cluster protein n=1 Tax=Pseudodesulfovibrio sp. TaxID=2035812 RepID=UPI00263A281C|nr:YkgJ family cysteine cluster protein [Pseudodesulfovibrio sp.]MDD3312638.1 YkgJ family cysteine cluster protein [Pseudodesulfovibrio sp.]
MSLRLRLTGWFRRARALILRREVEIIGQCALCGDCCHDILIQDGRSWLKSRRAFERLCEREPEYRRFAVTGRSESGLLVFACTLQGGDGLCTSYDSRLPLCRNYPTRSLYYLGGWLKPDCGYSFKATTFRSLLMRRKRAAIPKFSEVLRRETERKQD